MFCQKCGKENPDGSKFCGDCGANLSALSALSPAAGGEMTFGKAISTCMAKYADFKGRATRPEYWWFYLFTVLVSWGSLIVDHTAILNGVVSLALLVPSLSASARRLHDTNRSGWWMLISLTIIGLIPLIIWLASKSNNEANDYGDPA